MEVTLQELIESIKRDGVESGESRAEQIVAEAERKAEQIVSDAEKEAERLLDEARKTIAMQEAGSIASVRQAGRDLLISLQKSISDLFMTILSRNIDAALKDDDVVSKALITVLSSDLLSGKSASVELPENQVKAVTAVLTRDAAELLKKGYELKPVKGLSSGFVIREHDRSGYYGITPQTLAQMLGVYTSDEIRKLLTEAAENPQGDGKEGA
jgi:V/A-type H+/Na+-transporting ATPase subunit E